MELIEDAGIRKSILLYRFTHKEFNLERTNTIGMEFATCSIQVDSKINKAQDWETTVHKHNRTISLA